MDRLFHDIEQNTEEWMLLRATKYATASKAATIMANYGKAFGEPAKKYAVDIAIQLITGNPVCGGFSNAHMERGHEQEPVAHQMYQDENFCIVENGGFFEFGKLGDSPDGTVDNDGLVEIKSVIPTVHYSNVKRGTIDPAYKWQCDWHLYVTGREWIDFVSYCSDYPEGKQLYICRAHAKNRTEQFDMIKKRTDEFVILVDETIDNILNSKYTTEI